MSKKKKKTQEPEVKLDRDVRLNDAFSALKNIKIAPQKEAAPAPPPPQKKRSRDEVIEEAQTFERMMAGVTPLDKKAPRVAKMAALAAEQAESVRDRMRELVADQRFEVTDDGTHVEGRRVDVPPDAVRKLRRGMFPIDARLDLHGLHADEARAKITGFLADMRAKKERTVLLIHGKGDHSQGGVGVLRGEISAWLSQGPASAYVAAFATAAQTDGGSGATYVMLRR